jgi:hypothetical protein
MRPPKDFHDFLEQILALPLEWVRFCCVFACYKIYLGQKDERYLKLLHSDPGRMEETVRAELAGVA